MPESHHIARKTLAKMHDCQVPAKRKKKKTKQMVIHIVEKTKYTEIVGNLSLLINSFVAQMDLWLIK